MNTKKILQSIHAYLSGTRRVGHTTAMVCGAQEAPSVLVLVHNYEFGDNLNRVMPHANFITLHDDMTRMVGYKLPLAVDNAALMELCGAASREISNLETERNQAKRERDNWESTAAFHFRNEQYYRGIVIQIGEMLGAAAKMCDDGSVVPDVLCAKVAEVVASRLQEASKLRAGLEKIAEPAFNDGRSSVAIAQEALTENT